jgi:hypothetical protein
MNNTRVGPLTVGAGVPVGITVALGMTKAVCVGGTWVGVAWGAPQATSSAMAAENPSTHDSILLAALELTWFTCSVPAAPRRRPHHEARRPTPWLIVLQNHLPVNTGEFGDDSHLAEMQAAAGLS